MHRSRPASLAPEPNAGAGAAPCRPGVRAGLGVLATALLAGGWLLPLWQARLLAPQYPGGLTIRVYGHRVTGDVDEVNGLNHYIGMQPFDPALVGEMRLWPLVLALAVVAVVAGLSWPGRWPGRLAAAYLWLVPVGVLGAIQLRLSQFGHDLDPGAALRVDPFSPWVVGRTSVWNFDTWAWPGAGLTAMLAAAAVVTFGPRLLGRVRALAPPAPVVVVVLASLLLGPGIATTGPALAHERGHAAPTPPPAPAAGSPDRETGSDLAALLEATPPGGRLELGAGAYRGQVVIDEPVTIEGRDLPVVVGDGSGTVITVRAPGTVIRGIGVRGSGPGPTGNPAGIRVEADGVTIEGVVVEDCYIGIAVDGAQGTRIVGNHLHGRAGARIAGEGHAVADESHGVSGEHDQAPGSGDRHARATSGRGDGIWLHDAKHPLVRGNHVAGVRDGVYVSYGSDALVDGNHVHDSRYAVHSMFARDLTLVENHFAGNLSGAVLMYGGGVLLLRNHVEHSTSASTGFAALLKDVVDVHAVQNVLAGNRVAVHLDGPTEGSSETTFSANTFANNAVGVQAHSSARATFTANSFAGNRVQVLALGGPLRSVAWGDAGFGNFWSSYRGYDAHGDGRGSLEHVEGGAVDRLLTRNPALLAIADRPAMRLLRSVEERWGQRSPVLVDVLPLTVPLSPALATSDPETPAVALGLLSGGLLLLPAAVLLVAGRRRTTTPRSPLDARNP